MATLPPDVAASAATGRSGTSFGPYQDPADADRERLLADAIAKARAESAAQAGFVPPSTVTPAPPAQQADVRKVDNALAAANPSPNPNGVVPGAVPGLPSGAVAAVESPFTAYESTNPESRYDNDVKLTHTLSRMLGMAGLGEKALGMRDLHAKLQSARMDDLGEQAQRAFLAGDLTKGIDVFNHAVPNGQKITGYRKNADGTIAFQMADGRTESKTPSQIADTITAYRNPEVMSSMMKDRAKMLAETNKDLLLKQFQGSIDLQLAVAKGGISAQNAQALERLKAQLGADRITVGMDGTPWIAMKGGGVATLKQGKSPLTGKPEWQVDQVIPQVPMGASAPAPAVGTKVDPSRVPLAVAAQYQ